MHALSAPARAEIALNNLQLHRLETANQVIGAMVGCQGLEVFGKDGHQGRLEPIPTGGFHFIQGIAGAAPVNMGTVVRGRERLLPGFRGGYAAQRLLRCLVTYVLEGRSMPAGMLVRALMGSSRLHFHQAEPDFQRIIEQFRFSRVFLKPVRGPDGTVE